MRKIKEVLRLRFELQLGQREIARACSISQGAVHNYLIYGYSRFSELYGRWWLRKQDVVLRQNHTPGEKGFVDWAGKTIPVQDPQTGEIRGAALFLMVLGTSNYTYAEATVDAPLLLISKTH